MERTFIILKPSAIARGLAGEVISRFERRGLFFAGLKMMQLSDAILEEHYSHLKSKPFFPMLKQAMQATPVVVGCVEGKDAVQVVRAMCGATNCREALPGTIRADFGTSVEHNIIHASDSKENAVIEINRFFKFEELFDYQPINISLIYGKDELN